MSVTLTAKPKPRPEAQGREIPVLEADHTLARLADEFAPNPQEAVAVITRHGKPALAVLSWEYFESLLETLEVMGDEEAMTAIREYERALKSGEEIRTYDWEEIKKQHGLE